jgi:hypothetical protein
LSSHVHLLQKVSVAEGLATPPASKGTPVSGTAVKET